MTRAAAPLAAAVWCATALAAVPHAATKYSGVEPGWSKKADAVAALGDPVQSLTSTLLEFKPQDGTGPIFVELRLDGSDVVERVEVRFTAPVTRDAVITGVPLPATPTASDVSPRGSLLEYFGDNLNMVLTYAAKDAASGVTSIGYYSDVAFERAAQRLKAQPASPPTGPSPPPGGNGASAPPPAVGPPPPPPVSTLPPSVKRDPLACYDLYSWAQAEEAAARKQKQTARRQAAVDVRIAAQSGDCPRAKQLAADYKKLYGGMPEAHP